MLARKNIKRKRHKMKNFIIYLSLAIILFCGSVWIRSMIGAERGAKIVDFKQVEK